jgi:hypothetical protein
MKPGEQIVVKAFGGEKLQRVVVQVIENTVLICKKEEWDAAKAEHRDPTCVGFPLSAVVHANRVNA